MENVLILTALNLADLKPICDDLATMLCPVAAQFGYDDRLMFQA